MKTTMQTTATHQQDQFGRRVAHRLDSGAADLPHDVAERLRAARVQAISRRKLPVSIAVPVLQPDLAFGGASPSRRATGWWTRIASALPLVLLAAGLVTIHVVQNDRRAREVAEVDAALLTDTLPPAAYADPGFVQFLKSSAQR